MKIFVLVAAAAAVLRAQGPVQLPIADLPPTTVVATSDGKPITAGDIRAILSSGDPQSLAMAKNSPELFLGNLVVMRYLASDAEKEHLAEQSPLKEQLAFINNRFLASAAVNHMRESYSVPEEAINDFYTRNQSRYDMAHIKVIAIGFCPVVSTATATSDEELKRARAGGRRRGRMQEQTHGGGGAPTRPRTGRQSPRRQGFRRTGRRNFRKIPIPKPPTATSAWSPATIPSNRKSRTRPSPCKAMM